MPASNLKTLYAGTQSTFATSTAPTAKIMGLISGDLLIDDKVEVPKVLGNLGPGPLVVQVSQSGSGNYNAVATYEGLRYPLNGLFTSIAGTSSSGSTPNYTYAYTAPVTSTQVHAIYSMVWGTTSTLYLMTGGLIKKLQVKATAGGMWDYTVDMLGKVLSTSTGPTLPGDILATPIRMADTTLYVDASTGTVGATSVGATLISFDVTYETNRHLKTFGGSITPGDYGEGKHSQVLKIVAEFNASAKGYVDNLLSTASGSTAQLVQKLIRIKATQGTSAATAVAQIDFAGVLDKGVKLFEDRAGNITVALDFNEGYYSTSMTAAFAAQLQCSSSQAA